MNQTTIEDRCRGVLIGLAAGHRIGGPIPMASLLAESLLNCSGFNPAEILVKVNKGVVSAMQAELPAREAYYLVAPQFSKRGAGLRLTA